MRTTILFLSMAMLFVISPYVHAQEVCYPGLEQIPEVLNEDATDNNNFVGTGNRIFSTQITAEKSGFVAGIAFIRGFLTGGTAKPVLYSNENNSPTTLLSEIQPPTTSIPGIPTWTVDTLEVYFTNGLEVSLTAGDTVWAGVKFSGTTNQALRQFPEADGLRFTLTNPFANAFPADISSLGSLDVTNGIYGIYLIMEDCLVGCTGLPVNYKADFNQDGIVSVDDLVVLISAFNSLGSGVYCPDFNEDGIVSAADLGIFLSTFGATVDWQNVPE